jgi:hypothetical protein
MMTFLYPRGVPMYSSSNSIMIFKDEIDSWIGFNSNYRV